ncbi:hypothetical protein QNH99_23310 (plasmid) [Pantoea allii]|uniref:O-methyltransferase n=1 Tax=Pantoea allii TaxID=574096 RepID=UPI00397740DB
MPGTAHNIILDNLKEDKDFRSFLDGKIHAKEYFGKISEKKVNLLNREFNEDMLNLSARMPAEPEKYVDRLLEALFEHDVIPTSVYNKQLYNATQKEVSEKFIHGNNKTFIFPEESRLLFALADITKPKKIAFMGSYYAFWAVWVLAALPENSTVWLMDIDKNCQALAKENLSNLTVAQDVEIIQISEDAIQSIKTLTDLDWIVLDAEGPKSGVDDEDLIDKAIYYPMIRAGYDSLREGGLMIAHNILLENTTDSDYIAEKIEWNRKMFSKFIPFLHDKFRSFLHFESTEGVGIAKK